LHFLPTRPNRWSCHYAFALLVVAFIDEQIKSSIIGVASQIIVFLQPYVRPSGIAVVPAPAAAVAATFASFQMQEQANSPDSTGWEDVAGPGRLQAQPTDLNSQQRVVPLDRVRQPLMAPFPLRVSLSPMCSV
jgi:hypothetical protein